MKKGLGYPSPIFQIYTWRFLYIGACIVWSLSCKIMTMKLLQVSLFGFLTVMFKESPAWAKTLAPVSGSRTSNPRLLFHLNWAWVPVPEKKWPGYVDGELGAPWVWGVILNTYKVTKLIPEADNLSVSVLILGAACSNLTVTVLFELFCL